MRKQDYVIEGMTCGHCVARAKSALEGVPGVQSAAIQLESPQAVLNFAEDAVPIEQLQAALNEHGYSIAKPSTEPRPGKWSGKVVWVTGASSGIGRASALEFARQGARVILSARRVSVLNDVIQGADAGWRADMKPLGLDLADSDSMDVRVQEALACFGRIDAVVHCGGISQRSLAQETSLEVDRRVMEIDYFGTVSLTKAVLPLFLKQGSGQFVVVTSLMGLFSSPLRSGYCGAKHALHGFFESLRAEVHEAGIRITMVCPGFIHTDISLNAVVGDGSKQGTMDEKTGKGLSPEACAKQLVRAAQKERPEVLIGRSEVFGAYLKRFFPNVLRRVMRKAAVT